MLEACQYSACSEKCLLFLRHWQIWHMHSLDHVWFGSELLIQVNTIHIIYPRYWTYSEKISQSIPDSFTAFARYAKVGTEEFPCTAVLRASQWFGNVEFAISLHPCAWCVSVRMPNATLGFGVIIVYLGSADLLGDKVGGRGAVW